MLRIINHLRAQRAENIEPKVLNLTNTHRIRFLLLAALLWIDGCAGIRLAPDVVQASTAESTLEIIGKRQRLRVGTTGDFLPFSYRDSGTNALRGVDIEMARELAGALQVDLEFVRTTWPTLMQDLQDDRFDIGMSGITITAERRRRASFSIPVYSGGKVAIARDEIADRFSTIAGINQAGVRVIVNPGGTNEAFARDNFPLATIIQNGENLTVFDKLISREADVMVTDAIEAHIQELIHPELEAANSDKPFNQFQFAYLLPSDRALKQFVDAWLKELRDDGSYQRFVDAELERIRLEAEESD